MHYPVKLLSDFWPHGEIGRLYGVFDETLGMNNRSTFVIDARGVVREVIATEMSRSRDIERYVDAVRALL
jgi:alkyl hydroperoxide reductase subunit AhpC